MSSLKPRPVRKAGLYFLQPATGLEFISSGCTLLDRVLGGGFVLGRMSNVIGGFSTSKTGIAVEAAANFSRVFPKAPIKYREAEGAFDRVYAEQEMGFPTQARLWEDDYKDKMLATVEDVYEDIDKLLGSLKNKEPALYVVDSWDALSDRVEMDTPIDKATYGQGKAKQASKAFRMMIKRIEASRVCMLIVSQVRDNIGVTFGKKFKRSGGNALDFYASHCLWLANHGKTEQTKSGVERVTGIRVRARCEKNKVGLPWREIDFDYRLGYGIDDVATSLHWLASIDRLDVAGIVLEKNGEKEKAAAVEKEKAAAVMALLREMDASPDGDYRSFSAELAKNVTTLWYETEKGFLPPRRKYG